MNEMGLVYFKSDTRYGAENGGCALLFHTFATFSRRSMEKVPSIDPLSIFAYVMQRTTWTNHKYHGLTQTVLYIEGKLFTFTLTTTGNSELPFRLTFISWDMGQV